MRRVVLAALVAGLVLRTGDADAAPIALQFGGVSLSGLSETEDADLGCPPELGCGVIPFTKIRVTISGISSVNPLVIELIDPFFDPDLSPEEQLLLQELVEASSVKTDRLIKLHQQKLRELSNKRRPLASRITLPSVDGDALLLEMEYEGAGVLPPYLLFNVTDSITGESSGQRIEVVPEPGTLLCVGIGLAAAGMRRRRVVRVPHATRNVTGT